MSFSYEYPRPAVTVDVILITKEVSPKVLLIQRKFDPYKDNWAFPGGFLDMDEDLHVAAMRELEEETSIKNITLTQFKTYGAVERDPRGRTVSVVYYAFIDEQLKATAMDDAKNAEWFDLKQMPRLAFDHQTIIDDFKLHFKL
ncbi:NUDIX hydrolase [Labilibacter sediminis]|nr:NUDIX hydrolase [Labilibacter sediminis]